MSVDNKHVHHDSAQLPRREFATLVAALPFFSQAQAQVASVAKPFATQPGLKLNTGTNFPFASFGLQIYDDGQAQDLTLEALQVGYRNFFASVLARNQKGFARGFKQSGVPRDEVFICGSVLSNSARGFDAARKASQKQCKENMDAFRAGGIDYIDMIMLDYPGPDSASIRGQWRALEEMQASGLTRSIAVSNFSPEQLDAILVNASAIKPTVNQLPYGVGYNDYYNGRAADIIKANKDRGVIVQAWSPLQRARRGPAYQACNEIGKKYGKSGVQVALRWIVDTGATFTTQTQTLSHFQEDIDIFDFSLTKDEIDTLAKL